MEQMWITRLREQMARKGFSMKSLSAAAGQNETYIRDILERGRTPAIDKFVRVAEVLGVSPAYLLGERSAPAEDDQPQGSEAQLKSALLAFGVDRDEMGQIVAIIKTFVRDEKPEESPSQGLFQPSKPRREPEPSR